MAQHIGQINGTTSSCVIELSGSCVHSAHEMCECGVNSPPHLTPQPRHYGNLLAKRDLAPRVSSRLRTCLNEFAEETGIFGLNILRSGLSRGESCFWILCTLFFIYCTANDLATVTRTFINQDTVSLSSQIQNSSFTFDPTPSLSFYHGFVTFDFSQLSNRSTLEKMLDDFLVLFRSCLNETKSGEATTVSMTKELFELSMTMLTDITLKEMQMTMPNYFQDNVTFEWASKYAQRENHANIRSSVGRVYRRFRAERVNFTDLAGFIASLICKDAGFFVGFSTEHELVSPCDRQNMLRLTEKQVTFRIISNSSLTVFEDPLTFITISWDAAKSMYSIIDLTGTPMTTYQAENNNALLYAKFEKVGERLIFMLEVSSTYVMVEGKTSQPCSKSLSRYDCKQMCFVETHRQMCNCFPLLFALAYQQRQDSETPTCPYGTERPIRLEQRVSEGAIDHLVFCSRLNISDVRKLKQNCYDACLVDCRRQTFTSVMKRETFNQTRFDVLFAMQSLVMIVVEEKFSMTFNDFIAQFGGLLGLYLGISFAALVHVPVFAMRKAIQRFCYPPVVVPIGATSDGKTSDASTSRAAALSSVHYAKGTKCSLAGEVQRRLEAIEKYLAAADPNWKLAETAT